jgi:N-acetylornithine carbamoyltransferase
MTLHERFGGNGGVKGKKFVLTWAPHPKALPLATPHSQMLFPAVFGMDVTIANPEGFDLDSDVLATAKEEAKKSGGSLKITNKQKEAFEEADIVVAKSWASLKYFGKWAEESAHRSQFLDWTVNEEKMKLTNSAFFMHCLPVRRNVVVTDGVLDSKNSLIIQEAGNRMWAQMALISYLLK